MDIRYIAWVTLGIAAGFLVVASAAFALIDISNLALGVGLGALGVSAFLAWRYIDDNATLAAATGSAIVSAWMVIDSTFFSLREVQSFTLADGLALLVLSLTGLTVHELAEERALRSLTLRTRRSGANAESAADADGCAAPPRTSASGSESAPLGR